MSTAWEEAEDEAAALWVARHMGGIIDASAFSLWLAGAPGRKRRFDDLRASCMDPAVTEALEEAEAAASPPSRLPLRASMAAGFATILLALFLFWPTPDVGPAPAQDYATRAGEIRTVELADGSRITLGGNSRMQVTLGDDLRQVALEEGEAFFDIAPDAERPFAVRAGTGQATVLGTRFDMAIADTRVELAVEHGLVRFGAAGDAGKAVLVKAGFRTALQSGGLEPVSALGVTAVGGWRDGWIETEGMPLWRLVAELERWSTKPVRIEDAELRGKQVAGRFRVSDPRRQLDNLSALHGFQIRETAKNYVIYMQ